MREPLLNAFGAGFFRALKDATKQQMVVPADAAFFFLGRFKTARSFLVAGAYLHDLGKG